MVKCDIQRRKTTLRTIFVAVWCIIAVIFIFVAINSYSNKRTRSDSELIEYMFITESGLMTTDYEDIPLDYDNYSENLKEFLPVDYQSVKVYYEYTYDLEDYNYSFMEFDIITGRKYTNFSENLYFDCSTQYSFEDVYVTSLSYDELSDSLKKEIDSLVSEERPDATESDSVMHFSFVNLLISIAIIAVILLLPVIIGVIIKNIVSGCSIELNEDGIVGQYKQLFAKKQLTLPIEKVDSVTVQNGFFDKIESGETLCIRSASGLVRFHWVQNAQEFLDATLAEIQKYKETVSAKSAVTPVVPVSDEFEKIKKLKELLDSGVITQEEFEAKKKQLLGL